jgi:hypothetical protein
VAVTERSRARVIYRLPDQRASRAAGPSVAPTRLSLLLLALVLFSGGLVIGRSTTRPESPSPAAPAATPPSVTAANPPASAAAPATSATSATSATKVGPRGTVDGVGKGWAHSPAGAVAAATNYTVALGGTLVFDPVARDKAIAALAAPEAIASLQRTWRDAADMTRKALRLPAGAAAASQAVVVTAPLGHRVERYDKGKARIAIWTTGLAGSPTVAVTQGYGVTVVDLEWVKDDWKQVKVSSRPAPTPLAPGDEVPSKTAAFLQQIQDFKEYDYAPQP